MDSHDPRARLLALSEARAVSLAMLSRMIGKNGSYLQQFIRKGSPRKLEEEDRALLARFFGVSEVELGKAEENSSNFSGESWVDLPRLTVGASAGHGAFPSGEGVAGALRFSADWLRRLGLMPDQLSIITVEGDSMEPGLRDGDEILVDTAPRPLRDGIHVVRMDDNLLVKRVELGRGGAIILRSDNPAYGEIRCSPEELHVIGRVVWKGGRI